MEKEAPDTCKCDCRSEVGITVGLIDGIIAIARVLAQRDLSDPATIEALKDIRADEDVRKIVFENQHCDEVVL